MFALLQSKFLQKTLVAAMYYGYFFVFFAAVGGYYLYWQL